MTTLDVTTLNALRADDVPEAVRAAFAAQLRDCPSVHATFFSGTGRQSTPFVRGLVDSRWADRVAAALMCSGIGRSSLYGFSDTVDRSAADHWWRTELNGKDGLAASQSLTQWAFPAHCHDGSGTTFQDFLGSDQALWAARLADYVTTPAYINVELNKLIASDPNWLEKLNATYYKLHLLDPSTEAHVVARWTEAYPGALEQWQGYNYLASTLQPDVWLGAANAAIGVGKDGSYCTVGSGGLPICSYWTDYGVGVVRFLDGVPKSLGITTGHKPQNSKDRSGGGGGCFVGDSPVRLHSGDALPIRAVGAEHVLLSRDGARSQHTDERVVVVPHQPIPIYGFNGEEPFFTAGHLFWTAEGWKAFDPDVAGHENPKRIIGRLQPGDTVYRLRDATATEYDEVRIESFTGRIHPQGEAVYGVHLEDSSTYHVHGYLVGMNYPQITAQRLFDAFATLTPGERTIVAEALDPIMPLLRKSIGRFVEAPIARALAQQSL